VCDPGPPPPVLPSMPVFTGTGADPADWQGWTIEEWLPADPANMSLDTSSLGQYEVISPAVSAIPTCTLAAAATTSTPAAAPPRMMAPKKPPPQQRPSSPDFSVEESPSRSGSVQKEEGKEVVDPPADYLYWLTLHVQLASGLGSVEQQQQFQAMDNSLRSQLANDSGPLGTAAT